MTHYESMLAHLVRMARLPGAIGQARYRVEQLEQFDLYQGIGRHVAHQLKFLEAAEKSRLSTCDTATPAADTSNGGVAATTTPD